MNYFRVLPTDERFKALTEEQIAWIVAQMQIDRQEAESHARGDEERFFDETYEEWEEQAEQESLEETDIGKDEDGNAYFR